MDLSSFTVNEDDSRQKEPYVDNEVIAPEVQNEPEVEVEEEALEGQFEESEELLEEPEVQEEVEDIDQNETNQGRSRRTGTEREKAEKIRKYVIDGDGSVAIRKVKEQLEVGDKLVRQVYADLINEGHMYQTETKRYKRVS